MVSQLNEGIKKMAERKSRVTEDAPLVYEIIKTGKRVI